MSEIVYNKLVRDNIPAIITADNAEPVFETLTDNAAYLQSLLEKFVEEAKELLESGGSLDEWADVEEVRKAILEQQGHDYATVEAARIEKAKKRGSFSLRIFLKKVVTND